MTGSTAPSGDAPIPTVLVVTGLSGAGRSTAVAALEDLGYEVLNNLPLTMTDALLAQPEGARTPIAIGIETRTRGFSANSVIEIVERLRSEWNVASALVYLDSSDAVLIARFSETRRRHPLAPAEDPATGIARERDLLAGVREAADVVIDTSGMTPHDLKAALAARFTLNGGQNLSVMVQSFSFKRGIPLGADMALDCRFLQNPYWDETLRALDGRDERIQAFVKADPLYAPFFDKLCDMVTMLLPAYRSEGKAYFSIALGCTGGRHRSVTMAEALYDTLATAGWRPSIRHRELERQRSAP